MTERVEVQGADLLAATLHIAARRLQDASTPSRTVAAFIGTRGRSSAPVLTGRLAASVRYAGEADGAEASSGMAYANRTHWGYRRVGQPANPFLAKQVWNNTGTITDIYGKWTQEVLYAVKGTA